MLSRSQKYLGSFYGISVMALVATLSCAHKDLAPKQIEIQLCTHHFYWTISFSQMNLYSKNTS